MGQSVRYERAANRLHSADAIYDAIGVRINELPIAAEKVYEALQGRQGVESTTIRSATCSLDRWYGFA